MMPVEVHGVVLVACKLISAMYMYMLRRVTRWPCCRGGDGRRSSWSDFDS